MTLIEVATSDSRRRCDARCYHARGGHCDCVCGGANHGVGLARAVENTRAMAAAVLEQAEPDPRQWPRCLAYREDGVVCGRPAVGIHRNGGYPVCLHHYQAVLAGVDAR